MTARSCRGNAIDQRIRPDLSAAPLSFLFWQMQMSLRLSQNIWSEIKIRQSEVSQKGSLDHSVMKLSPGYTKTKLRRKWHCLNNIVLYTIYLRLVM